MIIDNLTIAAIITAIAIAVFLLTAGNRRRCNKLAGKTGRSQGK